MDELSTLVDVFCSSDEAWTEEDVAIFASTEEDEEEVAIVVESIVVSETLLSTDIFSVEEVDDVLMVFKEVLFTLDSEDDFVSFLELACTLVCLVSCLAELLADPDLARDVVFVIATVFLELLPVAPTVLAGAGGLLNFRWNLVCCPSRGQIY